MPNGFECQFTNNCPDNLILGHVLFFDRFQSIYLEDLWTREAGPGMFFLVLSLGSSSIEWFENMKLMKWLAGPSMGARNSSIYNLRTVPRSSSTV